MKKDQKTDDMKRSTKAYELIDGFVRLFIVYCYVCILRKYIFTTKRRENNHETGKL